MKTIVGGTELADQNLLKPHKKLRIWQSYKNNGKLSLVMVSQPVIIFHNFCNLSNFVVFHVFSTYYGCPTHSHQLLFPSLIINISLRAQKNLYQLHPMKYQL